MDYEENLIKEYNQLKSRVNIKSGYHTIFSFHSIINPVLFSLISSFLSILLTVTTGSPKDIASSNAKPKLFDIWDK